MPREGGRPRNRARGLLAKRLAGPGKFGVGPCDMIADFSMQTGRPSPIGSVHRYSAKRMAKPVNFFCFAPEAKRVSIVGDFNEWQPDVHPMRRQVDGGWVIQVPLHHGHHLYQFLVDGTPQLDPRAQGVGRNRQNEKASLLAVS